MSSTTNNDERSFKPCIRCKNEDKLVSNMTESQQCKRCEYFVSLHQHNIAHPQYTKCTVCTFPLTSELIAHETQQIKQQEVDYLPELIEETGEEDTPEPMEIDQPDQPMLTNASTSLDNTPVTVETSNVNVNANANATRGWFSWLW